MKFRINHKLIKKDIDPDETFLDSKNLPNFNTQQFEGRLEKAIPKNSIFLLGLFFMAAALIFLWKIGNLQIIHGEAYFKKSENNTLSKQPIFADRGLIYDRKDVLLAWNTWDKENINKFSPPQRSYINESGFGLLLGYISQPAKDSLGNYWQDNFIGKDGVEKSYNAALTGANGVHISETDVNGVIQSDNVVSNPVSGGNIKLSIDSKIQQKMYNSIASMAHVSSFSGGAGVIMDIKTGELLTIASYPEYNPNIISAGEDAKTINSYFSDKRKVFLNRPISGLYTPGSIVKPFIGYAALVENIITPFKQIFANGSISIPNPYFPDKKSIFKDHGSFGYVDMQKAIAISSDVYFYEIGGGYQDQNGLGIVNIDKYAQMFGISIKTGIDLPGEKSGIIPTPDWKIKTFKGDPWRVGDTYNTAIGQYGFQVTPLQMARAVAGIADNGIIPVPHVRLNDTSFDTKKITIPVNQDMMKVIQDGMRQAVTSGTATALNLPFVKVAAKSGTAQIGLGNTNTNSWIVGFFPYDNPKYSFAVLMEKGPKSASGNATQVMSEVVDYISVYAPEYLK
ncbi:MAG TPA: penicillin-binding transpeptidase domain-containing protein [Candidatus Paceibacterota bacterium]|nr:penicillin-binding transpeptidase domain-containing protein [Candidatus Paceibacterota bacterium]